MLTRLDELIDWSSESRGHEIENSGRRERWSGSPSEDGVWLLMGRSSIMGSLFFCSFTIRIVMGASLYIEWFDALR